MAATTHQYVAVVLAIQDMFSSIGGAVGQTVATAIWTATFRNNLLRFLLPSAIANVDPIYADIQNQLSYPIGSPERLGIQKAYGESQKWQFTAAVAVLSLMIPCVLAWRNYQLRDHRQVKGTVV
jgi:low affinity Fe/Cu permease